MGKIFVTGDIHGNPQRLSSSKLKPLTKEDVLIVLGDFGLLWSKYRTKEEEYWLKWLDSKKFTTCFIDGNHENFDLLNGLPQKRLFGGTVGIAGHSIFHLKRGQIYNINSKKILTIGGAHSHDREDREWGKSMWIDEEITAENIDLAQKSLREFGHKVDYILTHCAPVYKAKGAMDQLFAKYWQPDHSEMQLQRIFEIPELEYKRWFCGHYHTDNGPTYDGKFQCVYQHIKELTDENDAD